MKEVLQKLKELQEKLAGIRPALKLVEKQKKIEEMEAESKKENFWNDAKTAGKTMKEVELLKEEVEKVSNLEGRMDELAELLEMVQKEDMEEKPARNASLAGNASRSDASWHSDAGGEIEKEFLQLEKEINELEFKTLLGGEYDRNDAILSIHSGAGGVDAQDWAEMLLRMFLRWAEKNNFKTKIIEESRGQEAGIKSASLEISGNYAYGYLQSEAGTHRLVRLSPFNADNLRQTSFALVEVLPVIEEIKEVVIDPKDLRVDVYRSGGAGGQSVNTTDSAVRITHIPTGIVAACQNERSQLQNKEQAMKILKAKLHQKYLEERENERRKLRGENISAEWGSQIRSYVLHPYKMVKDHRTQFESSNPEAVLEGDLKYFMEAYLKNIKNSV